MFGWKFCTNKYSQILSQKLLFWSETAIVRNEYEDVGLCFSCWCWEVDGVVGGDGGTGGVGGDGGVGWRDV